jgi:hypothetical protein
MKSTVQKRSKRAPKSNPKDEKYSKTSNLPNARSPKRGQKWTQKSGPKKGTKIPPKCPMKSSFNFIHFLNFPECERSEPLFPNNLLLNFAVHFNFVGFLNFRRLPQISYSSAKGPRASVASCPFRNNLFLNFPGFLNLLLFLQPELV